MATKTCQKCRRDLPLAEFYPHPQMRDGYLGKCKRCKIQDVLRIRDKGPQGREYASVLDKVCLHCPLLFCDDQSCQCLRKQALVISNRVRGGKKIGRVRAVESVLRSI